MGFHNTALIGASGQGGYNLESSLRFRSSASAYLSRTFASAGNRKTWTWSAWVKRGSISTGGQWLFAAGPISTEYTLIRFGSGGSANDYLEYVRVIGGAINAQKISNQVFRDTSSWYHIVVVEDAANTIARIYVNGSEISYSTNNNPTNVNGAINNTVIHEIGRYVSSTVQYFDGYMTEVNFVDGQALTPSDFGSYDTITGVWKPKEYTGTYGTNGFYLPFTGEITPSVTAGFGGTAENVLYDDTAYLVSNTSTGSAFDLVEYDFGESINMIDYNIQDLRFTGGTSTFRIYTSDVGGSMSNYTERVSLSVSSSYQNYTGNLGVTARYIKIRATNFGTNGQGQINYFNVDVDSSVFSDNSGNVNNWTPNNINLITDVMKDVPTLTDEDTANFPILNINLRDFTYLGLINAGLQTVAGGSNVWQTAAATMAVPTSGKYYWETKFEALSGSNPYAMIGILPTYYSDVGSNTYSGNATLANGFSYYLQNGYIYNNGAATAYGSTATAGDVIGVAVDADNGKVWFSKNGTWQNSGDPTNGNDTNDATSVTGQTYDTTKEYYPTLSNYNGSQVSINFGQQPFKYTPPAGYLKLNTYNLPDSTIADGSQYFDVDTWSGDSNATTQIPTPFSPDFVWIKNRSNTGGSGAASHMLYDTIRGVQKELQSNLTDAEGTLSTGLNSFDSNGYKPGTSTRTNATGNTYVGWSWRASDSSPVTNTDGTITSTVSANPTSGFSVVTYTGNGTSGATVGHGLSVAPEVYIIKNRDISSDWFVYTTKIDGSLDWLYLNTNAAKSDSGASAPTSSVFSLTTTSGINGSGNDIVAYCFHIVEGFSKFGSFTGNGQSVDGPFIYTGFRPAFVLFKRTGTASWNLIDSARTPYNNLTTASSLNPDDSNAESTDTTNRGDLLSNGFRVASGSTSWNLSGSTYIYMAFAENPFKNSLAR